ncbi:centromere protein U isoform X2 [Alosa sapidissima]|uniref:centromere protein U isoform X2 n=1 Tax=Alosa sapidissima TaxID=34773 RepID=UPI001C09FCB0|nr:centromere protein U isoform X2 [Alosa sapidissima]
MSRMTKTLRSVKEDWKHQMDMEEASPDLSAIEKDSIFQDDQFNNDGSNPLHSTAMEDDFSPVLTHQKATPARRVGRQSVAERTETPRRVLGTHRRSSAAKQEKAKEKGSQSTNSAFKTPSVPPLLERVPSKPKPLRKISEETEETSASASQGTTEASASASQGPSTTGGDSSEESDSEGPSDEGDGHSSPVRGKNQRARRSQGEVGGSGTKSGGQRMSQGSSVAETQKKNRKSSGRVPLQKIPEENELQQGTSASAEDPDTDSDILSDENSVYVPPRKKKSRLIQCSQEQEEGESSVPPKKNARGQKKSRSSSGSRTKQSRKSSSGSSDAAAGVKRRRPKVRYPIDLEVVLEAFQDFVEEYKETVDSNAVQKAIDHMAESFVDQLTEVITATKELTTVKKKNVKLNTAINSKRAKLVDAKNELIQNEAKLRALEKEHQQLEQRLTDLTKGMSLLNGLTDLHTKYLDYCQAHPKKTESYGPTSLPALLMETRCMLGAEHQLKTVNAKLQQVLDNVDQK